MENQAVINSTVTEGGTINSTVVTSSTIASTLTGGGIGSPGPSGATGPQGACGASGVSGVSGVAGSGGTAGACGVSGVAGACGVSGTSGACGVSGHVGACGVSGVAGACGVSGTAGTNGTNGTNGACGVSGTTGACGVSGVTGVAGDKYGTTSTTSHAISIPTTSLTYTVAGGLAYTAGQSVLIYHDSTDYMIATVSSYSGTTLIAVVTTSVGTGTYTSWTINLDGAVGQAGACGVSGVAGACGVSGVAGACGVSGVAGGGGGGQSLFTKIVAPSGGDYMTLTAAIAAASNGWKIFIMPGTYTEAGFTTSLTDLTIVANGFDDTVLALGANTMEFDGNNTFIIGVGFTTSTGSLTVGGNFSTFQQCQWTGTGNPSVSAYGFLMYSTSGKLTNSNLIFTGTTSSSVNTPVLLNCDKAIISGNYFSVNDTQSTTRSGSIHFSCNFAQIVGNRFELNGTSNHTAIEIAGGDNTFSSNTFNDNIGSTGIILEVSSAGNVVSSNIITANTTTTIDLGGSGGGTTVISGNWINGKTCISILGSGSDNCIISGNYLQASGSSSKGANISTNNNVITGNRITNGVVGLNIVSGATKNAVTGNVILGNGTNYTDGGTSTLSTGNITS